MLRLMIALLGALAVGCARRGGESGVATALTGDAAFQQQLQEQLLHATPGSVIAIPAGSHALDRPLTLRANRVILRGAGTERSVLSFKSEPAGSAAVLVYGNDVAVQSLSIEDPRGDGLVFNGGENVVVRGVRVAWTGGPGSATGANGADGIRIDNAHNVLIEHSAALSASGTGIYVGQSRNVIVRGCHIEQNVVGIGIVNSAGADVAENVATGNGVGILVSGKSTRVFRNAIYKNNLGNPSAAEAADLPAGIGVGVLSASQVEIFDNHISDNQTANVWVAAESAGAAAGAPAKAIFLYGNRFSAGGNAPDGAQLKTLKTALFGPKGHLPDVVWDGRRDEQGPVNGQSPAPERICVHNAGAAVLNTDAAHHNAHPDTGVREFRCELPKLPAIALPGGG